VFLLTLLPPELSQIFPFISLSNTYFFTFALPLRTCRDHQLPFTRCLSPFWVFPLKLLRHSTSNLILLHPSLYPVCFNGFNIPYFRILFFQEFSSFKCLRLPSIKGFFPFCSESFVLPLLLFLPSSKYSPINFLLTLFFHIPVRKTIASPSRRAFHPLDHFSPLGLFLMFPFPTPDRSTHLCFLSGCVCCFLSLETLGLRNCICINFFFLSSRALFAPSFGFPYHFSSFLSPLNSLVGILLHALPSSLFEQWFPVGQCPSSLTPFLSPFA